MVLGHVEWCWDILNNVGTCLPVLGQVDRFGDLLNVTFSALLLLYMTHLFLFPQL